MKKLACRALALAGSCALCLGQSGVAAGSQPASKVQAVSIAKACGYSGPLRSIDLRGAVYDSLQMQPQLQIARADVIESKSRLTAARGALLPKIELSATDELYAPSNGSTPFVVVDNTVLGGTQAISAYVSVGLDWILWSSGRNWAAFHGASAGVRAAKLGVDSQLENTLADVLTAYEGLYEAEVAARNDAAAAGGLEAIRARAERRYERGYGTALALGRARVAALDARQTLNDACRTVEDKSAALERAAGLDMVLLGPLSAAEDIPGPDMSDFGGPAVQDLVDANPAVAEAKENIVVAQKKLRSALAEFGPTISLTAQRDYLGQDLSSFERANRRLAAADYRVGLSINQPIFPFGSQSSDVENARAQLRRARASLEQARLEAESRLATALSGRRDAERSFEAAVASLADAERILDLTKSQYRAGRADLDGVQRAKMDRSAAEADVKELDARHALAEWAADRVLFPRRFSAMLITQLGLKTLLSDSPKGSVLP